MGWVRVHPDRSSKRWLERGLRGGLAGPSPGRGLPTPQVPHAFRAVEVSLPRVLGFFYVLAEKSRNRGTRIPDS